MGNSCLVKINNNDITDNNIYKNYKKYTYSDSNNIFIKIINNKGEVRYYIKKKYY